MFEEGGKKTVTVAPSDVSFYPIRPVTETREKQWIVTLEELEKQNASLFCSEEILIGSERTLTDFVLVPKQTKLTKLFVFMDE